MKVELPLVEPIFGTYHFQGTGGAIIKNNPSIRNWYLNESIMLSCEKKFLDGYTSPELNLMNCSMHENPYLEKHWVNIRFMKAKEVNIVIRRMLDEGYYVHLWGVDDYYMEGKSWFHEKHFCHDCLIYGYDTLKKTYLIYAYNQNWVYAPFEVPISACNHARRSMIHEGVYGNLWALKPMEDEAVFDVKCVLKNIKEYLEGAPNPYPSDDNMVYGIHIYEYLVKYLGMLMDASIPYDRMDRRIFRLIWEHEKAMQERLQKTEKILHLDKTYSTAYDRIISESDFIHMLYAAHRVKRRDSTLPILCDKLNRIWAMEQSTLSNFIREAEERI